jgi:hypothetical protein
MEAELGVEAAGDISFEVSSPGAERTLILPQDLLRFKVRDVAPIRRQSPLWSESVRADKAQASDMFSSSSQQHSRMLRFEPAAQKGTWDVGQNMPAMWPLGGVYAGLEE